MKSEKINDKVENILDISEKISERIKERGQQIDSVSYYKDFEFKGSGFGINNAYVVKFKDDEQGKQRADDSEKERIVYEIYDEDNNLVASVNEAGDVEFEPEYIESLKEVNEKYFDTLTLEDAEFKLPEELGKDDIVLTGEEIEEKQTERKLEEVSKEIGKEDIKSYSEMRTNQTPQFEKIVNKQEIDPNTRVTQGETLADMIPELREKGIVKVGIVYSKGESGRFSFIGIDKDGKIQTIDSLQNTQGTTTGQKITSINSRDGSLVEEEQVAGMVKIEGRGQTNGQEEMLSVKVGQYGILEVDYVRADLSRDKEERYFSAPIETNNQRPTTREVREAMDKHRNTEISEELKRAEGELDRDGETQLRNIDDTASNDELTPDDIIVLEDGSETTLRKEAAKAKVSVERFTEEYNSMGGKTPDEKIDSIHEEIEEEFGAPTRSR